MAICLLCEKPKQTIPCQILLQVCRIGEMAEAPKLFLSSPSPEREAVLPQSDDTGKSLSEAFFWRTCCVQKLLLTFRTIFVHNIFSPFSAKSRASDKNLPVHISKAKLL